MENNSTAVPAHSEELQPPEVTSCAETPGMPGSGGQGELSQRKPRPAHKVKKEVSALPLELLC